ncbi:hypothetical protein GOP47_0030429 [Adiantum capillus-veneris]|nr:hypothetical protein GOP47_0030429 [Adiantum capillus-veneris]
MGDMESEELMVWGDIDDGREGRGKVGFKEGGCVDGIGACGVPQIRVVAGVIGAIERDVVVADEAGSELDAPAVTKVGNGESGGDTGGALGEGDVAAALEDGIHVG